jgi:hypothetical protein
MEGRDDDSRVIGFLFARARGNLSCNSRVNDDVKRIKGGVKRRLLLSRCVRALVTRGRVRLARGDYI